MLPLIILSLLLFAWDLSWYFAGVKPLFPWQLKKWLQEEENQLRLIDVRTFMEYSWFHIAGAVNRPELLSDRHVFKKNNVNDPIVVICMTGHRSPMVAYRLNKLGYARVYNLTWGMLAWKLFGGKTE